MCLSVVVFFVFCCFSGSKNWSCEGGAVHKDCSGALGPQTAPGADGCGEGFTFSLLTFNRAHQKNITKGQCRKSKTLQPLTGRVLLFAVGRWDVGGMFQVDMAMGHNLRVDEHPFATCFDVHQGTGF